MTSDTNRRTNSGRESEGLAFLPDTVVNLAESGSGGDPSRLLGDVDGDVAEVRQVEDEKRFVGDVRETVVVVAAASDLEDKIQRLRAEDGGADVALGERGDDDGRFGSGGFVESRIAYVSAEDGGVRRIALREDDFCDLGLWRFRLLREAFEEGVVD